MLDSLQAHRSDLRLESGKFAGAGAEVLRVAAQGTHYVVMGEDHGIAESAWVACALYELLQPLGYNTLAIEAGPYAAAALTEVLQSRNRAGAMRSFRELYPFSLAFYTWKEEFRFLTRARQLSKRRFRLIGVDQELMGASRLLLHKALEQATTSAIRARIQALLAEEAERYRQASSTGDPTALFMMAADQQVIRALRDALRQSGSNNAAPIDALLESRAIYVEQASNSYSSNTRRARLMKRTFFSALEERPEKVMLKLGSYHGFKGRGPTMVRELGALVAELADANDSRSLHILVLGVSGEQLTFAGIGQPEHAEPFDLRAGDLDLPGARPLIEVADKYAGWSLFDLRALRPLLPAFGDLEPGVEQVIRGYDLAIVMPKVSSATYIP